MNASNLVEAAAHVWTCRTACPVLSSEPPDELNRNKPAVDLLGRDATGQARLVLEHTVVESFVDQRSKQTAAIAMFRPLEHELSGLMPLPGRYNPAIKPGETPGHKREVRHIREWVAGWIRQAAPTLMISKEGPRVGDAVGERFFPNAILLEGSS